MTTEEQTTARQLSARNRGSVGAWLMTGYADTKEEPPKAATPTIGKSVKTYNNEDAANYARRMRGGLGDIMGMSQNYDGPNVSERPQSARSRGVSGEGQQNFNKGHGDSMKLVFHHTNEPGSNDVALEAPAEPPAAPAEAPAQEEAPASEPEVPSPAAETASVTSEKPSEEAAAEPSPAEASPPAAAEPEVPPLALSPRPGSAMNESPHDQAKAHALRNQGTLTQQMAGLDTTDSTPRSGRAQSARSKRPDSVADIFHNYGTPDATASQSPRSRVKPEAEKNYQQHRISNIF